MEQAQLAALEEIKALMLSDERLGEKTPIFWVQVRDSFTASVAGLGSGGGCSHKP